MIDIEEMIDDAWKMLRELHAQKSSRTAELLITDLLAIMERIAIEQSKLMVRVDHLKQDVTLLKNVKNARTK